MKLSVEYACQARHNIGADFCVEQRRRSHSSKGCDFTKDANPDEARVVQCHTNIDSSHHG